MQTSKTTSAMSTEILPIAVTGANREAELIKRVLEGQTEAFNELLGPHLKALTRVVKKFVRNEFDAEDIVQQTVLKAYSRLDQFCFRATFRTWLTSIALNEIRQNGRAVSNARLVFDGGKFIESTISDYGGSPLEAYERREAAQRLRDASHSLPLKYRIVVELFDLSGKSLSETQTALRISTSATKSRLLRARRRLGRLLTQRKERPVKSCTAADLA